MNRRKPVFVMLIIGTLIATALSFFPYTLTRQLLAKEPAVASFVAARLPETSAPRLAAGAPEFDAASWYAAHGDAPETHGLLIESYDHNRLYASHNPDTTFNPASLIKLSTSLVALKKLGANYRFQTRVYVDGQVDQSGTLRGRLYVIGSDPTFGDVGANIISRELRARGIKRIADELLVAPGFCFNFSESVEQSAVLLARALHLGEPRIDIAEAPPLAPLFVFSSHPLRDLLLYMNARSSNFIAERIGALVGGPNGIQQFLIEQLKLPPEQVTIARASGREHNRMTPRGLLVVIRALIEEAKQQGLEPYDIMPVANDDKGTLRRRLAGTGLEGAVVGKTGTLTAEVDGGMASLAGIVYTRDAGMIVFAILDQGNRIWQSRQTEDQLLAEVIATHATPRAIAISTPRQLLPSTNLQIERP